MSMRDPLATQSFTGLGEFVLSEIPGEEQMQCTGTQEEKQCLRIWQEKTLVSGQTATEMGISSLRWFVGGLGCLLVGLLLDSFLLEGHLLVVVLLVVLLLVGLLLVTFYVTEEVYCLGASDGWRSCCGAEQ